MTADDFKKWLVAQGFTQEQAAKELGVKRNTIAKMLAGGAIDKRTGLACSAIESGLSEWASRSFNQTDSR